MIATAAFLLLTFNVQARAADVPHISGGAGEDARQELLTKESECNLKIITADLAGVQVVIGSARKERVLAGARRTAAPTPRGRRTRR